MLKKDAISYYGTQQKLADAVERSQSTVAEWGEVVPLEHAFVLERLTRGRKNALKVDLSLYSKVPAGLMPARAASRGRAQ
jgi:hypothetical protein